MKLSLVWIASLLTASQAPGQNLPAFILQTRADPVSGAPAGTTSRDWRQFSMNDAGQFSLNASTVLNGQTSGNPNSVLRHDAGVLSFVAGPGDPLDSIVWGRPVVNHCNRFRSLQCVVHRSGYYPFRK